MTRVFNRTLSLVLALVMMATLMPTLSASADTAETLTVYVSNQGRTWKEDAPANLEMQKRLGFNLEIDIAEPGSNRLDLMIASGDIPDLCYTSGMTFLDYLNTGYFMELDALIDQYGTNLKEQISQAAWDLVKYDGHYYCIPYTNMGSKYLTHVRQDWLDALGLKLPATLDEYADMLRAFTFNDPDKNGVNDTYGLGNGAGNNWIISLMMIFGCFNGMPGQYYAYGDSILPYIATDDYRAALSYINGLWNEGVIDPEIFILKDTQAQQKMIQGIAGSFNGWWSTSSQSLVLNLNMDEIDPNVNWVPLKPYLMTADGIGGMRDQGSISGTWLVNADSKHPELAVKFLDYLATDEGFYLAAYGIEGQDYTQENGFVYRTESGQQAYNEMWLDPLMQFIRRQDILNIQQNSPTENADELLPRPFRNYVNSGDIHLFTDVFYGMPATEETNEYGAGLESYIEQTAIEFITGAREINDDNWNDFISDWKQRGGTKVLKAEVAQLNGMKGTTYKAGIE